MASDVIMVTGAAGFIGYHVAMSLLARGDAVVAIDNVNDYYDPSLKEARLRELARHGTFRFHRLDVADADAIMAIFAASRPARVIHLAAQAGVRYSIINPRAYIDSNITGFLNVLEACRHNGVEHLVYASSSSVYGANTAMPFSVHRGADHPVSLYAASKRANELMAHSYSHLYRLPTTGLRFFTVYGPWGRPDMAMFLFARAILEGRPIQLFDDGRMRRDFTYIDDVVRGVIRVADRTATPDAGWRGDHPDPATSSAPYRLYNIGNSQPVELTAVVAAMEAALGRKAIVELLPRQPGDVPATSAEVDDLARDVDVRPATPIEAGIGAFVSWYLGYHDAQGMPVQASDARADGPACRPQARPG